MVVATLTNRPLFKPRELRTNDLTHWYVEAEWADGTVEEIGEFGSIIEAWNWLAYQSQAWVEQRGN
jgi:hypothetical protein